MDNLKSSKHKKKYENDLLMLLNEADHIVLDDLELDNILKEQSKILCNINEILNFENNKGKNGKLTKNPVCELSHLNLNKSKEIINNMPKKKFNNLFNPNSMKITKKKSKTSFANKSKSLKKSIKKSKNSNSKSKSKSKNKSKLINKFSKKTNYKSMHKSIQKSRKNYKEITKKNLCKKTSKSRPITINKLTSRKKYIYKHNNKRKYDITITKPSIFIKQGKN